MVNMSFNFDEDTHYGSVSINFIRLFPHNYVHFELWPLAFKIKRVHPLIMVNMSTKLKKEAHKGLVSIVFTSLKLDTYGTTAALLYPSVTRYTGITSLQGRHAEVSITKSLKS